MAADQESGMDQQAHVRTYSRFLGMVKWGSIACAVVAAIVVAIIAN